MLPDHIKTVLFDFDGTLAPNLDLPDMRRQVIELTQRYKVPDEVYAGRFIVEIITAASAWLDTHHPQNRTSSGAISIAEAYFHQGHQLITDIELQAAIETDPFPGIVELLVGLGNRGYGRGVVTRNCRAAVLNVFPNLLQYVEALCARDDVEHLKPDPRHVEICLTQLAGRAESAAIVGDGMLDMSVGQQLGLYCVGVLSGSNNAQQLTEAGATIVLDFATDLIR